ncbi:MAG: Rpn family recombination-promoting nuclease/putative transposase [Planctomycetota bacterium]|nr:Rpn family recombination-promoting nuclease/putative transposase [Planctomycetota bacterium]
MSETPKDQPSSSEADDDHVRTHDDDQVRAHKDRFFQGYFGIADIARGFLSTVVPPTIADAADWERMELVRGAFVDEKLGVAATDLLWRIPNTSGDDAYVLVLWEHQSRPDKWIALRLLRYQVNVWMKLLQEDESPAKNKLPVICCVVLYQGTEPWNSDGWFHEIVSTGSEPDDSSAAKSSTRDTADESVSDLNRMVPDFQFNLVRLVTIPDDDLPSHPLARLGLTLMRAAVEHTLVEWCRAEARSIKLLLERDDGQYVIRIVLSYVMNAARSESETNKAARAIRSAVGPEGEKHVMNGLEILEKRGEKRGRFNNSIEVVRNLLDAKVSVEDIARMAKFDRAFVQSIANGETPLMPDEEEHPASET